MTVTAASAEDLAGLAALEQRCFSDPWSAASLQEFLKNPLSICLVCRDEKGIIGYLAAGYMPPECEVYRVAVAAQRRREGIGAALMQTLMAEARGRGCDRFFLEVRASNTPARALYAACGFTRVATRKQYYRNPTEDAEILAL